MTTFQGFRSLIEYSPDAISVIDSHGAILYGSASTTKMFGYQPEELVGRNCLELIHPDDREYTRRALKDILAKSGPLQWDLRILNKDGRYSWVESTFSNLLADVEVQAIVVHQRNIDARKAAEEGRKQHAEELVRSNTRLEEFAYTVAHDLREPLRTISVYTELMAEETQMDDPARQMAQFIVDGTKRMSALIDDLLAFAATGMREPPRLVDLQTAVKQARQNLALEIEESGARIMVESLPAVPGNEIQFVRLFQNLIGNALKYRGMESPKIHVCAERHDSHSVIRVEDDGIGIAPENHARVFMPFVRLANREVPGTGLGLAVCKNIVEGFGGTIRVESKLGAGSTFLFTIPENGKSAAGFGSRIAS